MSIPGDRISGSNSSRTCSLLFGILLLRPPLLGAGPDDWLQHQGPKRDGISHEEGTLAQWPVGGPSEIWRIPFFEGYSGMAVVGERLFTLYGRGGDEYVVCLSTWDGSEIWRVRSDSFRPDGQGGGPRSTPTVDVDGGVVYAVSARNTVLALNTESGRLLWSRDLKRDFGSRVPTWGVSGSPLLEEEKLILEVGGGRDQGIAALNKRDGSVIWTSHTERLSYSSPMAYTIQGVRQIVFAGASGLSSVASDDGTLLWTFPWTTEYDVNVATPILVGEDQIFYSSSYDKGATLLRIRRPANGFLAEEVWRNRVMKNHFHSSILYGDHLYGFDDGTLKCIRAANGEEMWRARGYQKGAMLLAGGHLIILGENGKLGLVEATPRGFQEKGSKQILHGRCWTDPALSNGRLYLRNQTEMLALDFAAR